LFGPGQERKKGCKRGPRIWDLYVPGNQQSYRREAAQGVVKAVHQALETGYRDEILSISAYLHSHIYALVPLLQSGENNILISRVVPLIKSLKQLKT
jgi:hypothetical protein